MNKFSFVGTYLKKIGLETYYKNWLKKFKEETKNLVKLTKI